MYVLLDADCDMSHRKGKTMESARQLFERAAEENKGVRIYLTKDPNLIGGIPVQIDFDPSEFPFMSKTLHHEGDEELIKVDCFKRPRIASLRDDPTCRAKVRELYPMDVDKVCYQGKIYAYLSVDTAICIEDKPQK